MLRSLLDAVPHAGSRIIEPAIRRSEAERLRHAREDHAKHLRTAAYSRNRAACGDRSLLSMHAWALKQCRVLRHRFPSL